jgi:5-methylcytosine-specific restriction endonuclease McrA
MPYKDPDDRDYKTEYRNYQGTPEQIKRRAMRNKARAAMMKAGKVKKGDGKDVDHVKPISKGGKNNLSNLRVDSASDNRSFPRNSDHSMKNNGDPKKPPKRKK